MMTLEDVRATVDQQLSRGETWKRVKSVAKFKGPTEPLDEYPSTSNVSFTITRHVHHV